MEAIRLCALDKVGEVPASATEPLVIESDHYCMWLNLSEARSALLRLNIKIVRLAMECGDVDICSWMLEHTQDFSDLATIVGADVERFAKEAQTWLFAAQDYECRNGLGSKLDQSHPAVVQRTEARRRRAARHQTVANNLNSGS